MLGLRRKILIVNDHEDCGAPYGPLFKELGEVTQDIHTLKLNPFKFKLVVFTGGADVSPSLYGDTSPSGYCHCDSNRDAAETNIFKFAIQHGIHMVGICRGMQFINVMTGGKMVHDLTGHNSPHTVATRDRDVPFLTNSFHHQMCIPHKDTHILAWANEKQSKSYIGNGDVAVDYKGPEVEAIYVQDAKAIGVQWHPEALMSSGDMSIGKSWFRQMVADLLKLSVLKFNKFYLGIESSKLTITEAKYEKTFI